jgi:hypothetical protein
MACEACASDLEATYESRLRLMGGGLILGYLAAGWLRSLGLDGVVPLGAALAAFSVWVQLRAGHILRLRPAAPIVPRIR